MIGTALKSLASQFHLTVSSGLAYGYLQGSFITLTEGIAYRRMSIYVGCVNVALPEGEEVSPAVKCSTIIVDMVTKGSGDENIYCLTKNPHLPAIVVNHSGSVVTLNFRRDEAGLNGLQRFIAEMLPHITPLTAPLQCSYCGGHTRGMGYPVRIAPDTVVPMHAECLQENTRAHSAKHHTVPAIIAAAVGALIGAAAWAFIFQAGYISVLGALIILALTLGGYTLLRGEPGRTQMIVVGACMAAAVLLGTVAGYAWMLHDQYAAYGSVVNSMMRESVYMRVAAKDIFTNSDSLMTLILNLVTGLVFAALGAASGLIKHGASTSAEKPSAMPGQA